MNWKRTIEGQGLQEVLSLADKSSRQLKDWGARTGNGCCCHSLEAQGHLQGVDLLLQSRLDQQQLCLGLVFHPVGPDPLPAQLGPNPVTWGPGSSPCG